VKINGRAIGPDQRPYIVAEISGEHRGSSSVGYTLIDEAQKAGADAVKFQCYAADTLTFRGDGDEFKIMEGPWAGRTLHDLYSQTQTPRELLTRLVKYAQSRKMTAFTSVFSLEDVEFVADLGVPAIKIASFELTDLPLIQKCAETGLPLIISTGMGTTSEIKDAINAYHYFSDKPKDLGVLHCVSSYPASPKEAYLPALGPLSTLLGGNHVVGLSDHSMGIGVAVGAVAFGASIIEKHFTLDRGNGGPDSSFSLEPSEFAALVGTCRDTWEAIHSNPPPKRPANLAFRKSLYVVCDMACGDTFSPHNVRSIRPNAGLPPKLYQTVLGAKATRDLKAGTPLQASMISALC